MKRSALSVPAVAAMAMLTCVSSALAQPFIVAGLDNWDSTTAPTVPVTAPGVTATATASGMTDDDNDPSNGVNLVPTNWSIADSAADPGRGSSIDTTWGTFDGNGAPASDVTDVGTANFTLTNAKIQSEVTFTITNNSAEDLDLDAFHMDVFAFRFRAARVYSLDVLAGSDITIGNVFASDGMPMNDNSTNDIFTNNGTAGLDTHDLHEDIDIDMTGLADNTLANGEFAIIQINFTGGVGDGQGGHHLFLDNVAFSSGFEISTGGDFDDDGDVDGADFLEWQLTDGTAAGLSAWEDSYGTPASLAVLASVPEPTSILLLLVAAGSLMTQTRSWSK